LICVEKLAAFSRVVFYTRSTPLFYTTSRFSLKTAQSRAKADRLKTLYSSAFRRLCKAVKNCAKRPK